MTDHPTQIAEACTALIQSGCATRQDFGGAVITDVAAEIARLNLQTKVRELDERSPLEIALTWLGEEVPVHTPRLSGAFES